MNAPPFLLSFHLQIWHADKKSCIKDCKLTRLMDAVLHRLNLKFKAIIRLRLYPLQLLIVLELLFYVPNYLNLKIYDV